MSDLFQGIFWLVSGLGDGSGPDLASFELLHFKVPCDANGEVLDRDAALNSKSGKSYNYKAQWAGLPKKVTKGHTYQYYPRGRVEIRNRAAFIFLNPVIYDQLVTERIKTLFGLRHPEIKTIKVKCDGSMHYRCWFDDPTIP